MQLDIITPVEELYSNKIVLVQLPGADGLFEIMKNHAPIISSLVQGKIKVTDINKQNHFFHITGGIVECKSDKVIVLANEGAAINE